MMPELDSTFEINVPYNGFSQLRAQAFALSEAVRVRYDLTVEEFIVCAINSGYKLSGTIEYTDQLFSEDDDPTESTFGYIIKLLLHEGGIENLDQKPVTPSSDIGVKLTGSNNQ